MTTHAESTARRRVIITPEGLALDMELGRVSGRAAAFFLDILILVLAGGLIIGSLHLIAIALNTDASALILSISMIIGFFLRNGYFLYFELYWQGATPGKKAVGLKVVSRDGGPLTTGAVFSRNLLRELEFFIPLSLLFAPQAVSTATPGWAYALTGLWAVIFLLMPLLNQDRARCGDLVAGTLVVTRPAAWLRMDAAEKGAGRKSAGEFLFTQEQLGMYGIRELQVLEEILRRGERGRAHRHLLRTVCDKITRKFAWNKKVPGSKVDAFLQAFYRAQRARLEHRLLMGERREKKRKGTLEKK